MTESDSNWWSFANHYFFFLFFFEEFGSLDIVCNNAGISKRKSLFDLDSCVSDWSAVVDINLTAVMHGTQLAVKEMIAQGLSHRLSPYHRIILHAAARIRDTGRATRHDVTCGTSRVARDTGTSVTRGACN